MKIKKEKKIKYIFYFIILIFITYNIIFLLSSTIIKKDYITLFGITFLNMDSDLMEGDISKNDLVIVKKVKKEEVQQDDIIAYTVNGHTRINKVINIQNGYTTKSNKNYYPNVEKVIYEDVIGEKVLIISSLGQLINILQSKVTSVFIFIFLVVSFAINKYKELKSKERTRKKKRVIG